MTRLIGLFVAGGTGVLARYAVTGLVQRYSGSQLPIGTFVENVAGCVIFGFIWSLANDRMLINAELRTILLTGFVGGFTTFSTYAFETTGLMRDAQWGLAVLNVAAHNLIGLMGVILGMALGRLV
ncbi:MAG: fluoride efflux transporter CrcB [Planctomycetales bacterium]